MIILWSGIFALVATAQIRVQGAINKLNPNSITRTNRAIKCAQLVSVDGGFIMFPGRGGAFPIPGTKGGLLIPGCLEIVQDSKEGKVVRAVEDLGSADLGPVDLGPAKLGSVGHGPADIGTTALGDTVSNQTKNENPRATRKYEIVDLNEP